MNITNVMTKIDDFIHQAKTELSCGNEFQAQRQLVKIRELLNSLPELEASGGYLMNELNAWNHFVKSIGERQKKCETADSPGEP